MAMYYANTVVAEAVAACGYYFAYSRPKSGEK